MDSLLVLQNGALATVPGGSSLLLAGDGATCCCGGACDSYFRARACGDSSPCPSAPSEIYVCAAAWLASLCPRGGVISVGNICYRVEDEGDPIPVGQLPPGAFTLDEWQDCAPDCRNCTLPTGFYQLKFCACRDDRPGQADINAVIDCSCEWQNRAAGMRCPTYQVQAPNGTTFCVQADLFAPPVQPAPGSQILCVASGDGCCECCNGFNFGACGTFLCGPFSQRFPGDVRYGNPVRRCCGERFRRTGEWRTERRISNPPFPDCTVREEHWRWDMDSGDPLTWFIYKTIIDRDPFNCVPVTFSQSESRTPFCDSVPTVGPVTFQANGTMSLTCTPGGWEFKQDSTAGNLAGGLTHDVIHETFTATLGVCGGPCERGGTAPAPLRRETRLVADATTVASPLPPLPLLGGFL